MAAIYSTFVSIYLLVFLSVAFKLNQVDSLSINRDAGDSKLTEQEQRAVKFFEEYSKEGQIYANSFRKLNWAKLLSSANFDKIKKELENITMLSNNFSQKRMEEIQKFDWRNFKNDYLKRSFLRTIFLIGDSGISDPEKMLEWKQIKGDMNKIFSTAKIELNKTLVSLEPNITAIFTSNRNYDFLSNVWKKWRDASGLKYRHLYPKYVQFSNEATKFYGYRDYGEYLRSNFETPDFQEQLEEIYSKLEKLYRLLHAYVKMKLTKLYPGRIDPTIGALPAHVLGDLWAQQWHNIFEDIKPFKDKPLLDVTHKMLEKNMTVLDMFKISEDFFISLGLDPMPKEFWDYSIFEKPVDGREINCHASAWDLYDGKDFRIKMCAKVSMNDLYVVHHEMGHIHYYMNYRHQPFQFKEGANPGFHEALGDLMTLSVGTPAHLYKIKLLDKYEDDQESDLNFLMFSALRSIAFAPFALTVDKWRWNVYAGKTTPDSYNTDWWRLRCKYQGLVPPVERSGADFDAGAKYHIAANVPYDRYFVSLILQFQFHSALCKVSNHTGPLHKCDIYESKEAGRKLRNMMKLGSSVAWPQVLKEFTSETDRIDPQPILDYFQPLYEWLLKQNLTDIDWNCESYINKTANTVLPYGSAPKSSAFNHMTAGHAGILVLSLLASVFINSKAFFFTN